MSTLHDRLADLAADAPAGDAAPGELWVRGVRRARFQRLASVAAVAVVTAVAVSTAAVVRIDSPEPVPVDVPFEELHLPKAVNAPGTWSDEVGPDGPLAALGLSLRTVPEGVRSERQHLELYGVSAVDGSAAWIDLPGIRTEDRDLVGWYALSPDGRWIGWSRHDEPPRLGAPAPLLGWAVMDTTTGKVREIADPTAPRLRGTTSELSFSGDSHYLLTSYETPDAPRSRGHQFVAWDVRDGSRIVLEEPGKRWLPVIGSAPSGVVWSRGGTVSRVDAATASRSSYSLPHAVMAASWARTTKPSPTSAVRSTAAGGTGACTPAAHSARPGTAIYASRSTPGSCWAGVTSGTSS